MAHSLLITETTEELFPERTMRIKSITICADAADATVEVFLGATVAGGESIAKLGAIAATSESLEQDIDVNDPISVEMTGANAKAYITYE